MFARKIDLFSYDEVQLGFEQESTHQAIEVGENHEGFRAFANEVTKRFPSPPSDWFTKVAFPAFEENLTILWKKNEEGS